MDPPANRKKKKDKARRNFELNGKYGARAVRKHQAQMSGNNTVAQDPPKGDAAPASKGKGKRKNKGKNK